MAIYSIVKKEDELLRQRSKEVPTITNNVLKLVNNMLDTMYAANGVGLAAPQIGVLKRVIVVDIGDGSGAIMLINPEILERSGSQSGVEGCLSCPDMIGEVERAQKIKVKGLLPSGEETIFEAEDYKAVALQHEIDHLDGILFIDKAIRVQVQK